MNEDVRILVLGGVKGKWEMGAVEHVWDAHP
jgi:hypothetical protein